MVVHEATIRALLADCEAVNRVAKARKSILGRGDVEVLARHYGLALENLPYEVLAQISNDYGVEFGEVKSDIEYIGAELDGYEKNSGVNYATSELGGMIEEVAV